MRLSALALALIAPSVSIAELSNDALIGPGLRSRPAYDGSASQRTELVPVIRYFGERWFVRSTQGVLEGGLRVELVPGLHAGAQLAYEPGRLASESAFLASHAVADIKRGASVGVHLEWDHSLGPRSDHLARASSQAHRFRSGCPGRPSPQRGRIPQRTGFRRCLHAGDMGRREISQCAVRRHAAAIGHRRPARVRRDGGNLFASVGLLGSVDLSPRWVLVGSFEARRLRGDAASSPLAERASNHLLSAGIAYRL